MPDLSSGVAAPHCGTSHASTMSNSKEKPGNGKFERTLNRSRQPTAGPLSHTGMRKALA
jgi:hypothetical protein